MRKKIVSLLFILLFCNSLKPSAQDNHYWSQQFGAKSTLLGGAMIGGVRDNSAIFYNPGAFTFIKYPSLSVNANLYEMNKLLIKDGAGEGVNLNSARVSIFPQIISGMLTLKKWPRMHLSYCLMTRHYDNILIKTRFTSQDFSGPSQGVEEYIGVFDYTNQLNEQWLGFAASYEVNDKLGVGISFFGNYRAQTYQQSYFVRKIQLDDSTNWIITSNNDKFLKYWTMSGLFKIGIAYETGRWKLGFTVTTPSFGFAGRGDMQREFSVFAASDDPTDTAQSFILMGRVSKTKVRFQRPLSMGFGVEYSTPKTRIALSGEYYFGIRQYDMMAPQATPFIYPPQYEDSSYIQAFAHDFLLVQRKARSVFNVAIGLEQKLFPRLSLLAGFHTDFSSYEESEHEEIFSNHGGNWDLYHCSLGLSFQRKKQIISVGITYTFSPQDIIDPYAMINPNQAGFKEATVHSQTFAISIGYTYLFPRE